eukprot:15448257-Alexandrium_andersonii.AAC.1
MASRSSERRSRRRSVSCLGPLLASGWARTQTASSVSSCSTPSLARTQLVFGVRGHARSLCSVSSS